MHTQEERALRFRALHERSGAFIIPNPWDAGTARLLESLGFEALATTSAGYAFSLGRSDHGAGRDQMMKHLAEVASAVDLPVSADLENGYGDDPGEVAETIRQAGAAGVVAGSIEDGTGRLDDPLYEIEFAAERIRAASEAAKALDFPFMLTARAENFIVGKPDLNDTIKRLQAYQEAGAEVLFAPGVINRDDIAAVVSSVDRPVNVLVGFGPFDLTLEDLSRLGVKRVSVGAALMRTAVGAFLKAAREMRDRGTFTYNSEAAGSREIAELLGNKGR